MRQVLFTIPTPWGDIPIFGFGVMLLVAFLACTWYAARRAKREGMNPDHLWDLSIWVFIGGIVGARILSLIYDPVPGPWYNNLLQFFKIWQGGLIFYGSIVGGVVAYTLAYFLILRKYGYSTLRLADLVAPCIGLGIFFGRIGCLLNGCCYGDVADPARVPEWQAVHFPAGSPPHHDLVARGYLEFDAPRSLGMHPAQLYSAIDGLLLFLLLTAYYPFRKRPGEVMALFLILYPINRFLLEQLRSDTPPEWLGLTLSQNISILAVVAGIALLAWLRLRPLQPTTSPKP